MRFWNGVMGWNFGTRVFETLRLPDGADRARHGQSPVRQPAVEQGPNVYMETPNVESALERVKELGGTARGDEGHSTSHLQAETAMGGTAWSLRWLYRQ